LWEVSVLLDLNAFVLIPEPSDDNILLAPRMPLPPDGIPNYIELNALVSITNSYKLSSPLFL
jgi:hypothetical protein